jgi:hypothetical protein
VVRSRFKSSLMSTEYRVLHSKRPLQRSVAYVLSFSSAAALHRRTVDRDDTDPAAVTDPR